MSYKIALKTTSLLNLALYLINRSILFNKNKPRHGKIGGLVRILNGQFFLLLLLIFSSFVTNSASAAISSEDKQTLQTNEDYLFLSSHIYGYSANQSINPYSDFWDRGSSWELVRYEDNSNTGFTAGIYENSTENKLVLAFGGTSAGSGALNDIAQDLNLINARTDLIQFQEVADIISVAEVMANQNGSTLAFTGHSLGGALAQFAGLHTGLTTVTFNTAPYSLSGEVHLLLSEEGRDRALHQDNPHIVNIRAANDYVSAIASAINAIPKRDDIGIKSVNGQWKNLSSLQTGHTLVPMINAYDQKYIPFFNEPGVATIIYQNWSIDVSESANLVITIGEVITTTYIKALNVVGTIISFTYEAANESIIFIQEGVKESFNLWAGLVGTLLDSIGTSIEILQRVKDISTTKYLTELFAKSADPLSDLSQNTLDMITHLGSYTEPASNVVTYLSELAQTADELDILRDTVNAGGNIVSELDSLLSTAGPFVAMGTSTYSLVQNWNKIVDSEGNIGAQTEAAAFGLLNTYDIAKAVTDSSNVVINALPANVKTKVVTRISKSSFAKAVQGKAGQVSKIGGPLLAGVSTAQLVGEVFNSKRNQIVGETIGFKGQEYSANVATRDIVLGRIFEKYSERELTNETLTREDVIRELASLSNLTVNITKVNTLGKTYSATKYFDDILNNESQLERAFCRGEMNTAICRTNTSPNTLKNWQTVYLAIYSVAEFAKIEDDEIIGYMECLTGNASDNSFECSNVNNNNFADIVFSPFIGTSGLEYKDVIRDAIEYTFPYRRADIVNRDIFGNARSEAVGYYNALYFIAFKNQRAETESAYAYQIGKRIEELKAKRREQLVAEEFKEATVTTIFTPFGVEFNESTKQLTAPLDTEMLLQLTPEFVYSYFGYNDVSHYDKIKTGEYLVTLQYSTANQIGNVSASYDPEEYGLGFFSNITDPFKFTSLNYTIPNAVFGDQEYSVVLDNNLQRKLFSSNLTGIERPADCPLTSTDIACYAGFHIAGGVDTPHVANAVSIVGQYAYIADGDSGLQIIDISNPVRPKIIGAVDSPGTAYDVSVDGQYAYLADEISGLQVVDISNPTSPTIVGSVGVGFATSIKIDGQYAYIAGGYNGFYIVDISNPISPTVIKNVGTSQAWRISIEGHYAYIADRTQGLKIVDISSPTNATIVGSIDTPGSAYDVKVDGQHAYVGTYNSGLHVIDVSNPSSPMIIESIALGAARALSIDGHYAYIANFSSGLQIVDISNPNNPTLAGAVDTPGIALGVKVDGQHAFIADRLSGLQVVDITNPNSPTIFRSVNTPGRSEHVSIEGQYAYIADASSGLQIVDIFDINSPSIVGAVDSPGYALMPDVDGQYAYLADGSSGLQIADISDPSSPSIIGSVDTPGEAWGVKADGQYAYVADGASGVQVVDVSNPSSPSIVATMETPGFSRDVIIDGQFAYIADYRSGLQIADISNPTDPSIVGSIYTPGYAYEIAVDGRYVYIATGNYGLQVVDVTNPSSPSTVASVDTPGRSEGVSVDGQYAYIADGHSGLQIVNISNPTNPSIIGSFDTPVYAYSVDIEGEYAYIADGIAGLQIVNISKALELSIALETYYSAPQRSISLVDESPYDFIYSHDIFTKTWSFSEDISAFDISIISSNFSSIGSVSKNGNIVMLELTPDTDNVINRIDLSMTDSDGELVLISGSESFHSIIRTNHQPDFAVNQITQMVSDFNEPALLELEIFDSDGDAIVMSITDNDGGYVLFDPSNPNKLVASFSDSVPVHTIKVTLSDGKESVEKEITVLRFDANSVGSFYSDVSTNHTYRKDIAFSTLQSIVAGQPDPNDDTNRFFRPDDAATWAEALKIIVNATTEAGFVQNSDVANPISIQPIWATPYYNTALALNAIDIDANDLGAISPTREQLAKLLVTLLGFDELVDDLGEIAFDFDDPESFSDYRYRWYGEVAHVFGVFMAGDSANAQNTATRGELARVVSRIFSIPKAESDISSFQFGSNFDISTSNIEASIINDSLSIIDNSSNVTFGYAINRQRLSDNEVPVSKTNKGTNDLIIALTNNGVSNIIRKSVLAVVSDADNDGILDANDAWPDDARYSQDENQNGIPDILDSLYGLQNLTPSDSIVIDGETVLISDLISGDVCPVVSTQAYNPLTFETGVFDSVCDVPDGWVIGNIPDSDNDGIEDHEDNCPFNSNANQANFDNDSNGDLCDSDDDNDGMPDTWENQYDLKPKDASDKTGDPDSDGRSNLQEYKDGTNPLVADEAKDLVITPILQLLLLD